MASLIPRLTTGTGTLQSLSVTFPNSSGLYNDGSLQAVVSGSSSLSITNSSNRVRQDGTPSNPSISFPPPGNGLWRNACVNVSASSSTISSFCSQGLTVSNGNLSISPSVFVMTGPTASSNVNNTTLNVIFSNIETNLGNIVSYTGGLFTILVPGYYFVSFFIEVNFTGDVNPRILTGGLVADDIITTAQTRIVSVRNTSYTINIYQCLYISESVYCTIFFTRSGGANATLWINAINRRITFFRLF